MVQLPENVVTQKDMIAWYNLVEQLHKVKASEMLLRMKIFNFYFPTPEEGTNSVTLPDGYILKAKYPIGREVDEGALSALADKFKKAAILVDDLIRRNPELNVKPYRDLTKDQQHLFDQCLVVKPGAPSLEIVAPAAPKVPKTKGAK